MNKTAKTRNRKTAEVSGQDPRLVTLRREIDKVDDELLHLLKKRFDISRKIGYFKRENGREVINPDREKDIRKKLSAFCASNGVDENLITELWDKIITKSQEIQAEVKKNEE